MGRLYEVTSTVSIILVTLGAVGNVAQLLI
jgi:hypothetical protein